MVIIIMWLHKTRPDATTCETFVDSITHDKKRGRGNAYILDVFVKPNSENFYEDNVFFSFQQDAKKFRLHALNVTGKTSSGNQKNLNYPQTPGTTHARAHTHTHTHTRWETSECCLFILYICVCVCVCVFLQVRRSLRPTAAWVCGRRVSAAPTCATRSRTTPSQACSASTPSTFTFSPLEWRRIVSVQVGSSFMSLQTQSTDPALNKQFQT